MPLIEESQDEEDPVAYRYVFRVFYFFKINLRFFVLGSSSIYIGYSYVYSWLILT